ncbi:VWA domain-containing protein [Lentzea flava]|uniref:Translocation protein TolB n=1 Tax=Lentzea flava TaxID=103732 RepID=A0ABQ2UXW5_9PSEU|nr:VWA domain-containing protein [Lentzea flava]MCP2202075.1 WD40-like Beta Propeller Repeat [Lentzea flava]GGU56846.1 translocation protein TolB [Lentzea flava]
MTVRALPLLLVALLAAPVPVSRAQPAPEPEPFKIGFSSSENDDRDVFTVDSNGNTRTNLTRSPGSQQEPAFSLDGTKLAYADGDHIVIANADGTNPRPLNNETRPQSQPAWSPDGTMIAVVTRVPAGEGTRPIIQIHRVSDGAKTGEIPIPAHLSARDTQPDWSPDGRTIAITRRSSNITPPRPEIEVPVTELPARQGTTFDLTQVVHTSRIPPKPDVVLLIDISQSMSDELKGVQDQLGKIMEEVKTLQPETRFGVATYAGAENRDEVFRRRLELTDNVEKAVAAVKGISLVTDPFSTEVWAHALIETATREFEFRSDASKVVVIIGDEPTAEYRVTGKDSVENAIVELKRANIRTVGVDSGDERVGLNSKKQIDDIIKDPKGSLQKYVKGAGPEKIRTAILDGIKDLDVTITPVPKCDTGLTVELTPPGPVTGPSGENVRFAEKFTVAPDATAGSTLRCTIEFRLNNEQQARPGYVQTVTVQVADLVKPVVRVDDVTVQSQDGADVAVTYQASATDSQNRPLTPVCTPPSGTRFPIGVTRVTCTATDARGNTGTDTAVVTVRSTAQDGPEVWLVTPDGSSQINLSPRFGDPCRGRPGEDPAWSPDGKSLAVTQDDQICVVNADGTGARVIVRGSSAVERPRSPAWLPDGTRIVFAASDVESPPDLWTVPVQNGTPRLLTRNAGQPAVQRLPRLTVTTTATPAEVPFNGKTTIEVVVANTGFAPAPATLTVTVPEGLTGGPAGGDLGQIAPGGRKVVSGEATGVTAGEHVVTAAVGTITSRVTVKVLERTGSLSLAMSASPQPAFVGGDDVTVTFKLLNSSGSTLTDVRVVASAFGCDPECAVGTLGPDGQTEVKLTIPATQAVDRELVGVVIATGPDEDAGDNVATTRIVVKQPTLTVDQQAGPLGGVVSVQGKDFPPGAKVRLGWNPGISETPGEITTADGTFSVQMLVFHNDTEGIRQATATSVEGTRFGEVKSGDFLALPSTVQPSDFVERG